MEYEARSVSVHKPGNWHGYSNSLRFMMMLVLIDRAPFLVTAYITRDGGGAQQAAFWEAPA
jgi:hypothetical protein